MKNMRYFRFFLVLFAILSLLFVFIFSILLLLLLFVLSLPFHRRTNLAAPPPKKLSAGPYATRLLLRY